MAWETVHGSASGGGFDDSSDREVPSVPKLQGGRKGIENELALKGGIPRKLR